MTKMSFASTFLVLMAALAWTVEVNGIEIVFPRLITGNWTKFGETSKVLQQARNGDNSEKFVTNGENTAIELFPYTNILLIDFEGYLYQVCTAVMVKRKKVVTTAHCTLYMDEYDHYVGMGIYDISLGLENPGSQFIKVKKFKRHHRFSEVASDGFANDIAMLTLESKAIYNSVVKSAVLAKHDSNDDNPGMNCNVVGYGLNENFEQPSILQSGYQVSISNNVCELLWQVYPESRINRKHICSMYYPVSACFGDGGGPLACEGKVVGLTSWGDSQCTSCIPTVFTRISDFRNWIEQN